jgi:hypothetical protein
VFGQEDVGAGKVGADAQGVFSKPDPALFPEGPVQERLGLAQRGLEDGRAFDWRGPEMLLDLPAQNGLADVLLALAASAKANRLGR